MPPTNLCAGDVNVRWTAVWFPIEKLPIQHDFPGVLQHKGGDVSWRLIETGSQSQFLPALLGPHSTRRLHSCRGGARRSLPELLGPGLAEVSLGEGPHLPTGLFWDEMEGETVLRTVQFYTDEKCHCLTFLLCLFPSACFSDVLAWITANAQTRQELRNF